VMRTLKWSFSRVYNVVSRPSGIWPNGSEGKGFII
jgi:hypothetical protein